MKIPVFAIAVLLGLGWATPAKAQSTQFVLGNFSSEVRLTVVSFAPVPRLDRYEYPYQGFYHYYALPGLAGETNYNPVSYEVTPEQETIALQYEFPESGNFVY